MISNFWHRVWTSVQRVSRRISFHCEFWKKKYSFNLQMKHPNWRKVWNEWPLREGKKTQHELSTWLRRTWKVDVSWTDVSRCFCESYKNFALIYWTLLCDAEHFFKTGHSHWSLDLVSCQQCYKIAANFLWFTYDKYLRRILTKNVSILWKLNYFFSILIWNSPSNVCVCVLQHFRLSKWSSRLIR